jgi:hypothetical protein
VTMDLEPFQLLLFIITKYPKGLDFYSLYFGKSYHSGI